MKMVRLVIDFLKIKTVDNFHDEMKKLFGFPDFYGRNIHALIDCLTSLRYPEDGMTSVNIDKNSAVLLEVRNLDYTKYDLIEMLFSSVQYVNFRCKYMEDEPLIFIYLIQSDG